jgi:trehalose 6-phosphate phosphatase
MGLPLTSLTPIEDALARRPFGLLCDVDGTLSPMAPTPAQAVVTPRNLVLLEQLSQRVVVAAVSGRDLPDLRRMVGLPSVIYAGLHGLAWWFGGEEQLVAGAEEYRDLALQAAEELKWLRGLPGIVVEMKTAGLVFHYRGAADHAAAREEILNAIACSPAAARFQVSEAVLAVELRPPLGVTKGFAVDRLAERFGLQGLLFAGDDVTDIDGFQSATRLRQKQGIAAYGIAVEHSEAPPEAGRAADFTLKGVGGMEWLLGEILDRVRLG